MEKWAIYNTDTGEYLAEIFMKKEEHYTEQGTDWSKQEEDALTFNFAEACATMLFIRDVIDWEQAEDLIACKL